MTKPQPVVVARMQAVPVCPAEVTAPLPDRPLVPDGAVIKANKAGHDWLDQLSEFAEALKARLNDARKVCQTREAVHGR